MQGPLPYIVSSLVTVLAAGLILCGGVLILSTVRGKGPVLLIGGGALALLGSGVSLVMTILRMFHGFGYWQFEFWNAFAGFMFLVEAAGWLLAGVGVVMLVPVVAGLKRQNRELKQIMAASRADGAD